MCSTARCPSQYHWSQRCIKRGSRWSSYRRTQSNPTNSVQISDIVKIVILTDNLDGSITNSDLKFAGLLLLWIIIEYFINTFYGGDMEGWHIALFSDISPTVYWVRRLAASGLVVAVYLLRALAFRLQKRKTLPLTPLHISGEELASFSAGMSTVMSQKFSFVNFAGGVYHDVTSAVMVTEYNTNAVAA
mmetsp:Transcript_5994/g.13143  ORF Transcript_5994/g.13143 Transcript_5994/m.13143 type:complete len:189 (-) Transcript_5994:705-1271(-)